VPGVLLTYSPLFVAENLIQIVKGNLALRRYQAGQTISGKDTWVVQRGKNYEERAKANWSSWLR